VWFFHPRQHTKRPRIGSKAEGLWWGLHTAATALGLRAGYSRCDVEAAFRELARSAHPDTGGTLEAFQALVGRRDLLLKHLTDQGTPLEAEQVFRPFNRASVPF
jgi:hypothetical protein